MSLDEQCIKLCLVQESAKPAQIIKNIIMTLIKLDVKDRMLYETQVYLPQVMYMCTETKATHLVKKFVTIHYFIICTFFFK